MKVIDLIKYENGDFYIPDTVVQKRYAKPFVVISTTLKIDKVILGKIIACEDFESIDEISFDVNHERTAFAVFYTNKIEYTVVPCTFLNAPPFPPKEKYLKSERSYPPLPFPSFLINGEKYWNEESLILYARVTEQNIPSLD